jgi:ribosomal protein S18 acetylase RimI-like enzyme
VRSSSPGDPHGTTIASWPRVRPCTPLGVIRNARPDDLPHMRELEWAAGEAFRNLGMSAVADDEPPTLDELAGFQEDGRAWVVTDAADKPVAYLLLDVVDGNAHIEQVSVDPTYARRGLGRALLDTAGVWADQHGLVALTLMTYVEVPWNAPYYRRLGFRVLADDRITSGLRRIREQEAARGLARWPRVTMWRLAGSPGDSA